MESDLIEKIKLAINERWKESFLKANADKEGSMYWRGSMKSLEVIRDLIEAVEEPDKKFERFLILEVTDSVENPVFLSKSEETAEHYLDLYNSLTKDKSIYRMIKVVEE